MKTCCTCKKEKEEDCFNKCKTNKDGLHYQCKDCRKAYNNLTKEFKKAYNQVYFEENKIKVLQQNKEYRENNKETISIQRKEYREEHKEYIAQKNIEYLPIRKIKIKHRRIVDQDFRLKEILRSKYHKMVNGINTSYKEIIGCSTEMFKNWLEFQFDENMNWDNLGSYWQIDHILPMNGFITTEMSQMRVCFNWTNLQPLEKIENRQKSDKLYLHYYFNSIINVHRFTQHYKIGSDGYQRIRESVSWLRNNSGMVKIP